ncbi:ribose-5-phosphate isomerase [Candidatus Kaiserbacteria bacterium RIFCSPHIGHO2_01_FULL_46_22]|uniref:Ribose-5-phosphate isomerase n=1 Tax=Candidatus Kaiserbacteria bacterium RIFCSPHIGHO2_01_FULL_46_22 TaxID=1798475 RepID=A0A1F6BY34_9BACT|nr:MAG: ribose-5-phosphate isomerase [Candidatus Kaiserbacteria bacterium RIFCSPHIGHO2_01_FULL_46_22]
MKIHFASDHAGFALKNDLLAFVQNELNLEVLDHGATKLDQEDDYPDFIKLAASAVSSSTEDRAIILGGSGQGEAMVANRQAGVRAAVFYGGDLSIVKLSREHNNANVLSLGARFISLDDAKVAVQLWLQTEFSGEERHLRRIEKLG